MKKQTELSLTQKATRALTEAVAKAVEDHRRRGIPLAVWREGRAVSIPASGAYVLHDAVAPYRTKRLRPRGEGAKNKG